MPDPDLIIEVGIPGPSGSGGNNYINQMLDVAVPSLVDGNLLVWDTTTSKWVARTYLVSTLVDGGNF